MYTQYESFTSLMFNELQMTAQFVSDSQSIESSEKVSALWSIFGACETLEEKKNYLKHFQPSVYVDYLRSNK